jgi:hypothetical protein
VASKPQNLPEFIDKQTAAELMGCELKSVGHVEGVVNGKMTALRQEPGLYRRSTAEAIGKSRAEAKAQREQERAERAEREAVQRREPTGDEADKVLHAVKEEVAES